MYTHTYIYCIHVHCIYVHTHIVLLYSEYIYISIILPILMFFVFQENLRFLNFLKEPCEKLAEATPPEIPAILPELLNYVRCQLSMGSWAIASVQPVTCLVEHFPHCQSLLCSVCLPWHHQHWSVHICHVTMSHWRPSFFCRYDLVNINALSERGPHLRAASQDE